MYLQILPISHRIHGTTRPCASACCLTFCLSESFAHSVTAFGGIQKRLEGALRTAPRPASCIIALASVSAHSRATLHSGHTCLRTASVVAAVQSRRCITPPPPRAERHRLGSRPWRQLPPTTPQRRFVHVNRNRIAQAAASPGDPYASTAQLRHLSIILGFTDYKDLQSLIR